MTPALRPAGSCRAITALELLIALTIGTVVLGCLMALWQLGAKMNRASQSTIVLQAALTVTESLFSDLRQMGLEPSSPPFIIGPVNRPPGALGTSLKFFKVSFRPDRVVLSPVRFHTTRSPGGNQYFAREEFRAGKYDTRIFKTCPIQSLEFASHTDFWGNDYLRAAVRVLEDDRPPGTAGAIAERTIRQQVLVRIPVPDRFGDAAFAKVNLVMKEAELLAP